MSDNVIHVSNTPIFDVLQKEYAANGKSYKQMVARPVLRDPWPKYVPTTPSWAKEPLPVREPGESLKTEMPDMVSVPVKKPFTVVPLGDSVMYHGPFSGGVSADEALEGIRTLGQMLTLEKPLTEILYSGTVDTLGFDSVMDSDAYVTELSEKVMADNPDYELTSIHVEDDMFNTNYKILIRGKKRPRD